MNTHKDSRQKPAENIVEQRAYTLELTITVRAEENENDMVDHTWLRTALAGLFPLSQETLSDDGKKIITQVTRWQLLRNY